MGWILAEFDPGGVIGAIVFIVVIIAQFIKVAKNAPKSSKDKFKGQPRSAQSSSSGDSVSPDEELRKFLEGLGGGFAPAQQQSAQPASLPPPVPRAAAPQRVSAAVAKPRKETFSQQAKPKVASRQGVAKPYAQRSVESVESEVGLQAEARKPAEKIDIYTSMHAEQARSRDAFMEIINGLRGNDSLRKLFILKEIIGPPAAFRTTARSWQT